jgi:hypothetical protein
VIRLDDTRKLLQTDDTKKLASAFCERYGTTIKTIAYENVNIIGSLVSLPISQSSVESLHGI